MKKQTRKLAGVLFIVLPTVAYGGISLLSMLINRETGYVDNPLRQDLWRAGHAHAGVLLLLSLIILRYIDETSLSDRLKKIVMHGVPLAAILIPFAFFFSVLDPQSTEPNNLITFAYIGFGVLTLTLVILGIGLVRKTSNSEDIN